MKPSRAATEFVGVLPISRGWSHEEIRTMLDAYAAPLVEALREPLALRAHFGHIVAGVRADCHICTLIARYTPQEGK